MLNTLFLDIWLTMKHLVIALACIFCLFSFKQGSADAQSLEQVLSNAQNAIVVDLETLDAPLRISFSHQKPLAVNLETLHQAKKPGVFIRRPTPQGGTVLEFWNSKRENAQSAFHQLLQTDQFSTIAIEIAPDPCVATYPFITLTQTALPTLGDRPFMPGPPLFFRYRFRNGRYILGDLPCQSAEPKK